MKRRDMLAATGLAGLGLGFAPGRVAGAAAGNREFIELQYYHFASADKRIQYDAFMAGAAVPALNRLGIDRVGVFENTDGKDQTLYVVMPHASLASFATATRRLMADEQFLAAGKDVLGCGKKDPVYQRFVTCLMASFDAVPKLEPPAEKKDTRLFQLRIYESHNVERALKKIAMFNEGGEVALFREAGMNPVFFGETLAGTKMPNLTYMITFDDEAAQKAGWKKFISGDGWKKLKSDPAYKDTVSNITNLVLKPTPASQL